MTTGALPRRLTSLSTRVLAGDLYTGFLTTAAGERSATKDARCHVNVSIRRLVSPKLNLMNAWPSAIGRRLLAPGSFSSLTFRRLAVSKMRHHRVPDGTSRGRSAQVRSDDTCRRGRLDGTHHPRRLILQTQVLKHECRGPDCRNGIGDAQPGDIGSTAVDRLEHARAAPLRVEVRAGGDAQTAADCAPQIGQDVPEEIGADNDLQCLRAEHEPGCHGVNQPLLGFDIR